MYYQCEQLPLKRTDNGKELFFTKFSCAASLRHKNLLMIHGLTYTQYIYDIKYKDYSLCEYFAGNGYTVWRIDLGGYGRSDKYDNGWEVTTENTARDTITALERITALQGVENADLIGWSWGTMITSRVSALRPDLIHKLIWLSPCFGGVFDPVEVQEPFTRLNYRHVIRAWQHLPGSDEMITDFRTVEPELHDLWIDLAYSQIVSHKRPNGGTKEVMEIGDGWLIDTASIGTPTLIIAGDNDLYVNLDRCYQTSRELPDGSGLLYLHGAGHALWLEKNYYKTTREAILAFIQE